MSVDILHRGRHWRTQSTEWQILSPFEVNESPMIEMAKEGQYYLESIQSEVNEKRDSEIRPWTMRITDDGKNQ